VGYVAALKSQADFESFLKKKSLDIQKGNEFSSAKLKDDFMVGWNSDVVIMVVNTMNYNRWNDNAAADTVNASLKELDELFSLKKENSIASIDKFNKLSAENTDAFFWLNAGSAVAAYPFVGMTKASDLIKDSYTAGTINFEKGAVTTNVEAYYNKDFINLIKKNSSSGLNLSLIENYPGNVNGFAAVSFNPKLFADVIRYIGMDGTANQFLQSQQFNLNIDEIAGAFKGDIAVVFSNLRKEEKTSTYYSGTYQTTVFNYLVTLPVGDKKMYDKLLTELVAKDLLEKQGDEYIPKSPGAMDTSVAFSIDNKGVIMASSKSLIQQYKSGSEKINLPDDVKKNFNGKVVSVYADIQSILSAQTITGSDSFYLTRAKQTFKDFSGFHDKLKDNFLSATYRLRTMNDQENSLVTILKFISDMNAHEKRENVMLDEVSPADTATKFTPPTIKKDN
jgi:hypothetical protein